MDSDNNKREKDIYHELGDDRKAFIDSLEIGSSENVENNREIPVNETIPVLPKAETEQPLASAESAPVKPEDDKPVSIDQQAKPMASDRDKSTGIALSIIGLLGVAGAGLMLLSFYTKHATSQAPPFVYLIVPLSFLYSGYYYLSGKNAARIQRKQGNGSIISKHYQKFGLAELLVTILVLFCIVYPILYFVEHSKASSAPVYGPPKTNANITPTAWPVTSKDKSTTLYEISSLASTTDQTAIAKTLNTQCGILVGNSPDRRIIADTMYKDLFNGSNPDFVQNGTFAKVHAGCADKNQSASQAFSDFTTTLKQYILWQKSGTWQVFNVGNTMPDCSSSDHIGIPPSILLACFDATTNKDRVPIQ